MKRERRQMASIARADSPVEEIIPLYGEFH